MHILMLAPSELKDLPQALRADAVPMSAFTCPENAVNRGTEAALERLDSNIAAEREAVRGLSVAVGLYLETEDPRHLERELGR